MWINKGKDVVYGLVSQQTRHLLIFEPLIALDCINFLEVILEKAHVCVPLRNLEDVLSNSISKFISIAKHHGELEQLIVIENIKNGVNELFVHLVETDDKIVDFSPFFVIFVFKFS